MKSKPLFWSGFAFRVPVLLAGLALVGEVAHAQLAITEAMSSASTNAATDFWELTNFGDEAIDLTGYRWNDNNGGFAGADKDLFNGITIVAGESLILVQLDPRNSITDEAAFRAWWGDQMPATTRIFFYTNNGLGSGGDKIRFWRPDAANDDDVVDQVEFGRARPGSTFTYDPATGLFGFYSEPDQSGAFRSALYNDIGSPGIIAGQVPAQILTQPGSLTVCAGLDATLTVLAGGFPRPTYQWYFKDAAVPGATAATLTRSNVQPAQAGSYFVEVRGATNVVRSHTLTLDVDTTPSAPRLAVAFPDVQVISNETARFFAAVCAYPPPVFQWRTNDVAVPGATNRAFSLLNAPLALSGLSVCVDVQNSLGATNVCARLTVMPRPHLMITEVMPAPSTNCDLFSDWFELTNTGTNAVDMFGYRFKSLNGFFPSLVGARIITNHVVLQPRSSCVFVRNLDTTRFVDWWNGDALPPGLQLIGFSGDGLRGGGDELYIWTPGAEDPNDALTFVGWGPATAGVSLCYTNNGDYAIPVESEPGVGGAMVAAFCGDVGSPGYTINPPPRLSRIVRGDSGATLRWRAILNASYRIRFKDDINAATWQTAATQKATNWVESWTDSTATNAPRRFYLLEQLPFPP